MSNVLTNSFNWVINYWKGIFKPLIGDNVMNFSNTIHNIIKPGKWGFTARVSNFARDTWKTGVWLFTNTAIAWLNAVPTKPVESIYNYWIDIIGRIAEMSKIIFSWPGTLLDRLAIEPIEELRVKYWTVS